jgi:hypothetical protein
MMMSCLLLKSSGAKHLYYWNYVYELMHFSTKCTCQVIVKHLQNPKRLWRRHNYMLYNSDLGSIQVPVITGFVGMCILDPGITTFLAKPEAYTGRRYSDTFRYMCLLKIISRFKQTVRIQDECTLLTLYKNKGGKEPNFITASDIETIMRLMAAEVCKLDPVKDEKFF